MLKITSLQCRRARGLLQWNLRDLSHKSGVTVHRLTSFERGQIHLRPDENKGMYTAFKEEGIIFQEFGEVGLDPAKAGRKDKEDIQTEHLHHTHKEEERYHIDDEEYRRLTGLEALAPRGTSRSPSKNKRNNNIHA